jgi:hypothetical protein
MVTENNVAREVTSASRAGKRVLLAVLIMIAVGLFVQVGRSQSAPADPAQPSQIAPATTIAVVGPVGRDTNGIYLIDTKQETICVYEYRTAQKNLRLLAARQYTYDVQLASYNTDPSPQEIRQLVETASDLDDAPINETPAQPDDIAPPIALDSDPRVEEMP